MPGINPEIRPDIIIDDMLPEAEQDILRGFVEQLCRHENAFNKAMAAYEQAPNVFSSIVGWLTEHPEQLPVFRTVSEVFDNKIDTGLSGSDELEDAIAANPRTKELLKQRDNARTPEEKARVAFKMRLWRVGIMSRWAA